MRPNPKNTYGCDGQYFSSWAFHRGKRLWQYGHSGGVLVLGSCCVRSSLSNKRRQFFICLSKYWIVWPQRWHSERWTPQCFICLVISFRRLLHFGQTVPGVPQFFTCLTMSFTWRAHFVHVPFWPAIGAARSVSRRASVFEECVEYSRNASSNRGVRRARRGVRRVVRRALQPALPP